MWLTSPGPRLSTCSFAKSGRIINVASTAGQDPPSSAVLILLQARLCRAARCRSRELIDHITGHAVGHRHDEDRRSGVRCGWNLCPCCRPRLREKQSSSSKLFLPAGPRSRSAVSSLSRSSPILSTLLALWGFSSVQTARLAPVVTRGWGTLLLKAILSRICDSLGLGDAENLIVTAADKLSILNFLYYLEYSWKKLKL